MMMIEECCRSSGNDGRERDSRSGSGSCNIIVAQRRRRNRFSGHRCWSHAVVALQLMVAVLILPYGTNAFTVPGSTDAIEFTTELAEELVTTTSADAYSPLARTDSERTATALVNTETSSDNDESERENGCLGTAACAAENISGASDDFVGSNVEFRESALTENLEETIRNSVKNEIEMEQNNGLNSNAKTKQGEKLAEDILHMEYALKDSELDNNHKSNNGQQGERKDNEHDNNINDIPEVELERGDNKDSVREARNLDTELEQEHNLLSEHHDDVARGKNISSSSLESSYSESYSYDSNDENDINSIDSDDDNSPNVQRIEELITSSTVRALAKPPAESAPKLTTTSEPDLSIISTEINEAEETVSGEDGESLPILSVPAQSESTVSMSSSPSSDSSESSYAPSASRSVSNELSSTIIEDIDSPPTFESHQLDVVEAEREPTEIPVSPETTPSDDTDGDVLSIVFNETLSAKESIVLQVDEQLETEPMSNIAEEKADEHSPIISEDDIDKHVVIKKQGVVIDDPLPKTDDDDALDISNVPITPIDRTQEDTQIVDVELPIDVGVINSTNSDAGETLNPSTNAALPETSLSPTSDSQDHDGSVTEDLSEMFSSGILEYATSTPAASSQPDDTAATLFDTPAPRNVGQTFNENLAAESSSGIGKALPKRGISVASSFSTTEYRSTAIILLSAGIVALLFMVIAIFLITFQRQQGTLDIEMQEKRCGKDDFDEEVETCMKLLEVELPPVAITAAVAQETDECL